MQPACCACARATSPRAFRSPRRLVVCALKRPPKKVLNDYSTNRRRSLKDLRIRIEKHLVPYFGGHRHGLNHNGRCPLVHRTTAERDDDDSPRLRGRAQGRNYSAAWPLANSRSSGVQWRSQSRTDRAETMFTLSIQAGKTAHKPHIPMLRENNVRTGFFEPEQIASILKHLPDQARPVVQFAYLTGWRLTSEVLPLEWRHIDFEGNGIGSMRERPRMTRGAFSR